nr:NADH dehydrogenase subunit 6 [Sarcandra glabra]
MILSVSSSPALVSGLMVARAKNPVHSVSFSIPVFRDTSGLLLLLGLDFSAMISPVVHIGAIAASFLFVVMMFHIQIAETHEEVLRYLPVSGIIGLIFWWEMFFILDNETIPLLFLAFCLCQDFVLVSDFWNFIFQGGLFLGGRALAFLFKKMGCSSGLALAILFGVRVLITNEAAPSFGNMVLPDGASEPGASTSTPAEASTYPLPEWERALSLPEKEAGSTSCPREK